MNNQKPIRIGYVYTAMDNSLLVLLLLLVSIAVLVVSVTKFTNGESTPAIILLLVSLGLIFATLYCAAFLIRVIHITSTHFVLHRPYARFWFKPIKKELINIPLSNIKRFMIMKETDAEGDKKEIWKIQLNNKSSVTFPYKADKDELDTAISYLAKRGIIMQVLRY